MHDVLQPGTMHKVAAPGGPAGSTKLGAGSTGFGGPSDRMEAESDAAAISPSTLAMQHGCNLKTFDGMLDQEYIHR